MFDKKQAEKLIKTVEETSEKTGNPFILDVVGNTSVALIRYIDFIADKTEWPFLIDGPSPKVRLPAVTHALEIGLRKRAIYNSIDYLVSEDEIKALQDLKVQSAVIMAFSPRKPLAKGRVDALKGFGGQKGLLQLAQEAGIEKMLIDTAVLDVPGIGFAALGIHLVKEEFGLPAGCGPSNAVNTWKRLTRGEFGSDSFKVCTGGSGITTQMMGANFVLYGPIELS